MIAQFKTPVLNCFSHILWFYFLTDSKFSYVAMLAKAYPVSGPTHLPQIPNQLHCVQTSAHEVLRTTLGS